MSVERGPSHAPSAVSGGGGCEDTHCLPTILINLLCCCNIIYEMCQARWMQTPQTKLGVVWCSHKFDKQVLDTGKGWKQAVSGSTTTTKPATWWGQLWLQRRRRSANLSAPLPQKTLTKHTHTHKELRSSCTPYVITQMVCDANTTHTHTLHLVVVWDEKIYSLWENWRRRKTAPPPSSPSSRKMKSGALLFCWASRVHIRLSLSLCLSLLSHLFQMWPFSVFSSFTCSRHQGALHTRRWPHPLWVCRFCPSLSSRSASRHPYPQPLCQRRRACCPAREWAP